MRQFPKEGHVRIGKKGKPKYNLDFLASIRPDWRPHPKDPNRHESGASLIEWQKRRDAWEQAHRDAMESDE